MFGRNVCTKTVYYFFNFISAKFTIFYRHYRTNLLIYSSLKPNEYKRDDFITSIITETGLKLRLNDISNDYGFSEGWSGYYPEYDILLLEGGHSSDMAFSIKTGETDLTIGNPEYIITSPRNTYRINGSFSGQECISHFFKKKVNEEFVYLTDFFFCLFEEFYWISETKFIYIQMNYQNDSVNGEEEYFVGEIKE